MGEQTFHKGAPEASTVMWGSPSSSIRSRSYNKAAESNWDVPAVRHEVQLRKQPARDQFNYLVGQLQVEQAEEATTAENAFVQSVLNQRMAYLDTTRFAKLHRDKWPKNWAKRCEKAQWWEKEVVTGDPTELKTKWRLFKRLEDSQAACDAQYGRILAKTLLCKVYRDGLEPSEALMDMSSQWVLRLKDEDLTDLIQLVPEEHQQDLVDNWPEWLRAAAANAEEAPAWKA